MNNNRIFNFVEKHLAFLKAVPLAPQIFEGFLLMWTWASDPNLLDTIDDIRAEVLTWNGVTESVHKYGGVQFNCAGKEIGHLHGNGILDIKFSRKIKAELMQERLIANHHIFTNSGWISFYIRGRQDTAYAINLLRQSYAKINFPQVK